jgi:DNA polymerase-3 subunit delta'
MAYRPVVSASKLAVFFAADRMSLPAANSILKLAEEPPAYGKTIFMTSNPDLMLPTIRSRAWMVSLQGDQEERAAPPPSSEKEWLQWMGQYVDMQVDHLVQQLEGWTRWEVAKGRYEEAARMDRLRLLVTSGKLSQAMSFDLIVWGLKEGVAFEHVFDDFR